MSIICLLCACAVPSAMHLLLDFTTGLFGDL